ncbi:hypothetical protein ACTFIW_002385 [Dictyostelium discoideum]
MSNWSFPLFDCCSTPFISLVTCCCCPCQVARQRATLKRDAFGCGQCLFSFFCLPFAACLNRYEIRAKHNIRGTSIGDCVCCCWCGCCATVQQARELDYKGDKPGGLFMSTGDTSKDYQHPNSPNYGTQNDNLNKNNDYDIV